MNFNETRPAMLLHIGFVTFKTMPRRGDFQCLAHLVVQCVGGNPQHVAQCRLEDFERRRKHAQGQHNQDCRVHISCPLCITLMRQGQRREETDQQAHRQHGIHQPTDVVELNQRRFQRSIFAPNPEVVAKFDHGKHRCVEDDQPQFNLAPAIDDAEYTIQKGIDRNQ